MCTCEGDHTMENVRLLVRVKMAPVRWQYMGQYDLSPSDPLSIQEWAMQLDQVRPSLISHYLW